MRPGRLLGAVRRGFPRASLGPHLSTHPRLISPTNARRRRGWRPRTFRQHGPRRDSGQVSAVATTLTLLLIVSYIANYISTQLPGQMQTVEFQHQLLVEDQLDRIQSEILALGSKPAAPVAITSPVSLGSGAVPPFGSPALGTLWLNAGPLNDSLTYGLSSYVYASPNWGNGSLCTYGTCSTSSHGFTGSLSASSHCSPPASYNYSGSNKTYSLSLSGSSNCLSFDILGSHDTIAFTNSGSNDVTSTVVIYGSYDFVTGGFSGSGNPTNIYLFGSHDSFNDTVSGSNAGANVFFVGESAARSCPSGNVTASDTYNLTASGSGLLLNLTWIGSLGYQSAYHKVAWGSGSNSYVGFENESLASYPCAFYVPGTATYPSAVATSLTVALDNRYIAPSIAAYEAGAVILDQPGGTSLMISGPDWSFSPVTGGEAGALTLVQFVGNSSEESGVATSIIDFHVLSRLVAVVTTSSPGDPLTGNTTFGITTEFPGAWSNYLYSLGAGAVTKVTCRPVGPLASGHTCTMPAAGQYARVTATMPLVSLTVTEIEVQATVEF